MPSSLSLFPYTTALPISCFATISSSLARRLTTTSPTWRLPRCCSWRRKTDRKSTRLNSSHLGISYAVEFVPLSLHDRSSDLLLRDNIIFIGTPIDDNVANLAIAQMLFLAQEDPEKDIQLYINSPGGSITAGMAIYDTMQYVRNDVTTICIGQAASMAALLLSAGQPKKRLALPNSRILIHQPSMGGLSGQATDIDIHAREILRMREITNQLLAKHTGQKLDKVEKDVERDFIMNSQQAKEYGIIDDIIYKTR